MCVPILTQIVLMAFVRLLRLLPAIISISLDAMIQVAGPQEAERNFCIWIKSVSDVSDTCLRALPGWVLYLILGAVIVGSIIWTAWPRGDRAKLKVSGPHPLPDHLGHDRWRFRVHNRGPATAANVHMRLIDINPRPKYGRWQGDYPYPVMRVGKKLDEPPSRINVGDSEDYEVQTWKGSDGNLYASLNTKDVSPLYMVAIEPSEVWKFQYELTAENAKRIPFYMRISVKDGAVLVENKK